MCVPLTAREQVLGVLYVDSQDVARSFEPEDLELLAAIASQGAIAVENAALYAG